jgi:hypothetical protein
MKLRLIVVLMLTGAMAAGAGLGGGYVLWHDDLTMSQMRQLVRREVGNALYMDRQDVKQCRALGGDVLDNC